MGDIKIIPNSYIRINKDSLLGFLKIINTGLERRAFKIKTTRPKDYLVKPSIGIIHPDEEIMIEVNMLELFKIDEMHKFAVEIYDINWRQNNDTLKRYLKSTQISPLLIHRLGIQYETRVENEYKSIDVDNNYIPYICLIYLTVLLVYIFMQLFNKVDN